MKVINKLFYAIGLCGLLATMICSNSTADSSRDLPSLDQGIFVASLFATEAVGETPGANYCRCKPVGDYGAKTCLAGNAISFRPICYNAGGDCDLGANNC